MMPVFTDVPKIKVCFIIFSIKATVVGNILVGLIILLLQEYKHVKQFDGKKFEFASYSFVVIYSLDFLRNKLYLSAPLMGLQQHITKKFLNFVSFLTLTHSLSTSETESSSVILKFILCFIYIRILPLLLPLFLS